MSAVAIIMARGGSKRIPRKNAREFAGKPMIAWPIGTALGCGLFDRVIVSTDDAQIAEIGTGAGAEVPFIRPAELSDDHAGTLDVVHHAVDWLGSAGSNFDTVCCLYGTAAFASPDDLIAGWDLLTIGDWDYVFAAGRFARPPQRAFVKAPNGAMALLLSQFADSRSQDLEPAFYDAGQFYWGSASAWAAQRPIYGKRTAFIELPPSRALDIDTPEDWAMAERAVQQAKAASR